MDVLLRRGVPPRGSPDASLLYGAFILVDNKADVRRAEHTKLLKGVFIGDCIGDCYSGY